ncbi:MAG: class I SAM-dependent methyltransferase [candidate division WOR-3 bacterium]
MNELFEERKKYVYKIIMEDILSVLKYDGQPLMCDVGCADGSFTKIFGSVFKVFGVDISRECVDKARIAGVNAYKVDVSSERLPFEDNFFHVVHMGEVIEHLINPDFAIREVRRVLKEDGFLVLSTPNLACWYNRLLLLLGIQPIFSEVSTVKIFGRPGQQVVGHLRLFTLRTLKEFLKYHRFKIIKIKGTSFDKLPTLIRKVDKFFTKIPSLSSIIIIVAQKEDEN